MLVCRGQTTNPPAQRDTEEIHVAMLFSRPSSHKEQGPTRLAEYHRAFKPTALRMAGRRTCISKPNGLAPDTVLTAIQSRFGVCRKECSLVAHGAWWRSSVLQECIVSRDVSTDVSLISSCLCLLLCNKNSQHTDYMSRINVNTLLCADALCGHQLQALYGLQTYHNLRGTRVFIKLDSFWGNYVADPHAASQSAKSMVQSTTPLHM